MEEKYTLKQLSEITGLSPSFIKLLEEEDILSPERRGRRKFYGEDDLEKLRFIRFLKCDMGVNVAGIEIILNMREKMERMVKEQEKFLKELKERLRNEIQRRLNTFEDS